MISELVQNVTQHTASGGELVAVLEPGATIMVSDRSSILQTALPPDDQRIGGRGLAGIGRKRDSRSPVADRWGVGSRTAATSDEITESSAVQLDVPGRSHALVHGLCVS